MYVKNESLSLILVKNAKANKFNNYIVQPLILACSN